MAPGTRNSAGDHRAKSAVAHAGKSNAAVLAKATCEGKAQQAPDNKAESFLELAALLAEFDTAPVLDPRSAKEIMDDLYDEIGLPK